MGAGERHVPTLTEVMLELKFLEANGSGRYFAGYLAGVRDALSAVEKLRLQALKANFTKAS